jgi:hypothetical protein
MAHSGLGGRRVALGPPASATIKVNQEPPTGHLHYGQHLLSDDGSCPTGQIEELVSGRSAKGVKRLRRCVHRSRAREAPRLGA